MNEINNKRKFLTTHEWVQMQDDGSSKVGISDFAQDQLGDIVFVELPEIGQQIEAEDEAAIVESVKAASEINSPLSGEVIEINEELEDNPEIINSSPYDDGWFYQLSPSNIEELDSLLDEEEYINSCES